MLLRRALVLALLLASALLGGTAAASAHADTAGQVTDIFSGTVAVRHAGAAEKGKRSWDYTVTVRQVFKGDISTRRVQVRTLPSFAPCDVTPLQKDGEAYTFRVARVGDVLEASACRMIAVATDTTLAHFVDVYGEPHDPVRAVEPTPAGTVQLSPVDSSAPTSFTRLAAPGAALVIIALLGLVAVRRMNRTRLA